MPFERLLAGQCFVPERTYRLLLPFPQLGKKPAVLVLRHCGEENSAFFNAWIKRTIVRGVSATTVFRLQREIDAPIIGEHGVVSFDGICEDGPDDTAIPIDFTSAKAIELLRAIAERAPDRFDAIREIVHNADLFRGEIPSAVDVGKE
jgi:hypothetical protein